MIPVLFIALLARYEDQYLSPSHWKSDILVSSMLFEITPKIREVIAIVMTVWLAALVVTMIYWGRQFWKLRKKMISTFQPSAMMRERKSTVPADSACVKLKEIRNSAKRALLKLHLVW